MTPEPAATPDPRSSGPFALDNRDAYARWRDGKLRDYPRRVDDLAVEVADPRALTPVERQELVRRCRKANMAVYVSRLGSLADKAIPRRLGEQLGLRHLDRNLLADEDAITSLQVVADKGGRGYIPYTSRRLLWHTDGYYNAPAQRIRSFLLHCVSPAASGGENALLDPEIAYIQLRDRDPELIRALMDPLAMTIPANTEEGADGRSAQSGPVFAVDTDTGCLHMRYTARTRSIVWKDDAVTRAAVAALEQLLAGDSPYVFRHRLAAGEGLVSNNVLHNRTEFADAVDKGVSRLIYRARYFDRIAGTALREVSS